MKFRSWPSYCALLCSLAIVGSAEEKFATLKVGDQVYSNVTVTTVTVTDIYFTHAKGMGNAKLKNLAPEIQERFHFDAAKSAATEKAQSEANTKYLRFAATNRPAATTTSGSETVTIDGPTLDENGDLVASKLYAASFRGKRPPTIIFDEWLTPPPAAEGKFVLVTFWATWAEPCREAIPHLNELQAKFQNKLAVIGLSNETAEDMKKMKTPRVNFYVATDTQSRTLTAAEIKAIPHSLLIDPTGIVRYEGQPTFLDPESLERLMSKYSP